MHRAAHGSDIEHRFEGSTKLLAELEQEYPRVFAEPEFPITEHRMPFSIPLVDLMVQPTHLSCIHCHRLSCKSCGNKCINCLRLDVLYQAVALMVHPYCLLRRKVVVVCACALIIDL